MSELEADLQRCGATLVIGPYCGSAKFDGMNSGCQEAAFSCVDTPGTKNWSKFRSNEKCAKKIGIPFCGIIPNPTEAGIFQLRPPKSMFVKNGDLSKLIPRQNRSTEPNAADDEVLVLFTSGTTGNKKTGSALHGRYAHCCCDDRPQLGPHGQRHELQSYATFSCWDYAGTDLASRARLLSIFLQAILNL